MFKSPLPSKHTHTHTHTRTGHQKRNMRPVSHSKTGRDLLDQKH